MFSVIVAALLQAAALQATPPQARPSVITTPDWVRRPTYSDMRRVYPDPAYKHFLTGRALISCQVKATGSLADCAVVEEVPRDQGFGDAAVRMSDTFKMRPLTKDGTPVDGGVVRIPIRFTLAPDANAGPISDSNPAYTGAGIELNCRYQGAQLDDCFNAQASEPVAGAFDAAMARAKSLSLPAMPRPAGRLLLSVRFDGERPAVPPGATVTAPEWIRRPTGEDVGRVFPSKASRAGINGEAITSCKVTKTGELADCLIVSERPLEMGFGEAALKLMPIFKMRPMTKDGQAVEGGSVRIPMRFTILR